MLLDAGAAVQAEGERDLILAVTHFLDNKEAGPCSGKKAYAIIEQNRGAVRKSLAVIEKFLV